MAELGLFRHDLLFRLNTITFELPPLRERLEDLPELAQAILLDLCRDAGRPPMRINPESQAELARHSWPGNIRELRNVMERALLFCRQEDELCVDMLRVPTVPQASGALEPSLKTFVDLEHDHIKHVLRSCEGRVEEAAKILGVPRSSLYAKIKKFGIDAR
jgi:DNA-binding NtrC family response regulator